WRAARAVMASGQLEILVRSGKVTGGGPVDTVTVMVAPSLAVTGDRLVEAAGCWVRITPATAVVEGCRDPTCTVKWSRCAACVAAATVWPVSDGTGWLAVKTCLSTATTTAVATSAATS